MSSLKPTRESVSTHSPTPPHLHTHPLPGLVVRECVCCPFFASPFLFCLFLLAPHVYVVKLCFPLFFPAIFCWPCNRVNCFRFDDEAIDCVSFYGLHFGLVWFALNLHCVLRGEGELCWCCFYGVDIGNIRFGSGEGKSLRRRV